MSGDPLAGYRALLALTEHERAVVEAEDWDACERIASERSDLVATLPAAPPAAAAPLLERCASVQAQTTARLRELRDRLGSERARVGTARRVAQGYGGGTGRHQYVDRAG